MERLDCSCAIVGAGMAGLATAYYLGAKFRLSHVALIDHNPPMSFTSACSGENYRNWWPHPVMTAFTDFSIDLMEAIAQESRNRINMTRRGYVLATRGGVEELLMELHRGYGANAETLIRVHDTPASSRYRPALAEAWEEAPNGVDVLCNQDLIRTSFPGFPGDINGVLHIRRAGDISGQQLGQLMLEGFREAGGQLITGRVQSVETSDGFSIDVAQETGTLKISADMVVNAAGPFAGDLAAMFDVALPIHNVLQQKIAFEDRARAIPRDMPFAIDLDDQLIDWTKEERTLLGEDLETTRFAGWMPGAIHCRPDGGLQGRWIKLGWAFNQTPTEAGWTPPLDDHFPEIVLRGAARLNPALKTYYGRLPSQISHYGGYYTMTEENWPLIGPMGVEGAFVVGALSGFGTMAACGAGNLCASWVAGRSLPAYAEDLSVARYKNEQLIAALSDMQSKGVL